MTTQKTDEPLGAQFRKLMTEYATQTGQPVPVLSPGEVLADIDSELTRIGETLPGKIGQFWAMMHIATYRVAGEILDPALETLPAQTPQSLREYAWGRREAWRKAYGRAGLPGFDATVRENFPLNAAGDYDLERMRLESTGFFGIHEVISMQGLPFSAACIRELEGYKRIEDACSETSFYLNASLGRNEILLSVNPMMEYCEYFAVTEDNDETLPAPVPDKYAATRHSPVFAAAAENRQLLPPPGPAPGQIAGISTNSDTPPRRTPRRAGHLRIVR